MSQWPLTQEKLQAAQQLMQEQLDSGHISPSNSPWNSPIFVIKKKSGKWRLIQDLREVNATMHPMGALQPGLPSPAAIPKGTHKIILDLKDCFYTIPLAPQDCQRFAFSIPSVNFKEPMKRYQWNVLPQGMLNSVTLCQKFVAQAIQEVRNQFPQVYTIHYTDDILLAHRNEDTLLEAYGLLQQCLSHAGLVIAPEKVQRHPPFQYLGHMLYPKEIKPQKIEIRKDDLKTLNDFQRLLGNIQWLRPYLRFPTGDLEPLSEILKGDSDPNSSRQLSEAARQTLSQIEQAIQEQQVCYIDYSQTWQACILPTRLTPTAVLWQNGPLLWMHLPVSPAKVLNPYFEAVACLAQKCRMESRKYFGKEPAVINVPYTKQQVEWLFQNSDSWAIAFAQFQGQINNLYPADQLLQFAQQHSFIFPKIVAKNPLKDALLIFTDGSSNGKAAYVVNGKGHVVQTEPASAQIVELRAVALVFKNFDNKAFNLYTDSRYIYEALRILETVSYIATGNEQVKILFQQIQKAIQCRKLPCFVGHIRAHSSLPGPLAEGNALADELTKIIAVSQVKLAQQSHALHHQNSLSLRKQFKLTREAARQIVKQCERCPQYLPVPHLGVNPRGLLPNHIWQMDVTHITEFGKLRYVHVTIDTYSGFIMATAQTGEAAKHVITHCLKCFSCMGTPKVIKTDNGSGYVNKAFQRFCTQWNIVHKTGIPYNPQGQGIVERAHGSLKTQLQKIKTGELYPQTPHNALNHALFTLNFLNTDVHELSAADRLWHNGTKTTFAKAKWKDPANGTWKGPDPILIWGRGHVCVFSQDENQARWLPERLIRCIQQKDNGPKDSVADNRPTEGTERNRLQEESSNPAHRESPDPDL